MAVGRASGDDRARKAAEMAISSQLLDVTIDGARGILFNVTGGKDMTLFEVNEAAAIIKETAHPDVNLIFGAVISENMAEELRVTVIATGFEQPTVPSQRRAPTLRAQPIRSETIQPVAHKTPRIEQPPAARDVASESTSVPPVAKKVEQPEPFPVPSFDKEDLDIPAFLRRRK